MLDFKRFCADELASFLKEQTDNLRRHVSGSQWITTNTMPNHHPVDPPEWIFDFILTLDIWLLEMTRAWKHGFRIASSHVLGFLMIFIVIIQGKYTE